MVSSARGVNDSCVPLPSVGSQSQHFLDVDFFHTWAYVIGLIRRTFQALVLHMCVRGDCSFMIEPLDPLTDLRTAHFPQWHALKLLAMDVEVYSGDSEPERLWETSSSEPLTRKSWLSR